MQCPEADAWNTTIKKEIKAHLKNDTWEITNRKSDTNIIGSKLILKTKYKSSGEVERRKAHIVASGFSQRPGLDYSETYAPVARLSSIRLLLALSVEEDLIINQLDVTTAFLNGELAEELYMKKPKRLEYLNEIMIEEGESNSIIFQRAKTMLTSLRKSGNEKVCRLKKAIYGLKQAARKWFEKLDLKLKILGFKPSSADPCIYISAKGGDKTLISIYVDDLILASNSQLRLNALKKELLRSFEMRDLGDLEHCLGIEFRKQNGIIYASQTRYIDEIISRFNMSDCNPVKTPMDPGQQLKQNKKELFENIPYQNLIGALMYLVVGTRPDTSHSVSYLSQFNNCYDQSHWLAANYGI